ncbi:MAG TPA: NAD(P)/FAD-dependent oxidoreductase [Streptosporangiaceae bacterium]|jgi:4-hydroxyacetophenone monooxygenase|nr:NAD(P)/FAD-dependent oxidoreductase [Streptosporangiaceae bacterium]
MALAADDNQLRDALSVANLPTLLLVLARLTGDPKWLEDPYRPSRTIALDENDSGGFSEARQAEIRAAMLAVLREERDDPRSLPPPAEDQIIRMLSISLGDLIPPEYAPVLAEEGLFRAARWQELGAIEGSARTRVLVIGAGFSGICAGLALRRLGLDFTIVERNPDVGGTWLQNNYPGAAVDTPSHLYSYSFAPQAGWSRFYPRQPELLGYLRATARDAGLYPSIQFDTAVVSATWDEPSASWIVRTRSAAGQDGELRAEVLISAVGLFNQPELPDIPGLTTFPGPAFHASRWDHRADLAGKRVAVIGAGATAMQVVPALAGRVARLTVFQRSPQWVAPNPNYLKDVAAGTRLLLEQVPEYRAWYRMRLFWMFQDKLHPSLFKDPDWPHPDRALNAVNDRHRRFFTDHLDAQLAGGGEHLRDALLPTYPAYGKRILMDNNWFTTLRRDDVKLVAEGVTEIDGSTVITSGGQRHDFDAIVFATGWTARRFLHPMHIVGRSHVPLREQWGDDDAWGYLGMAMPGFPNMFILYGPNTNVGHGGSAVFNSECQVNYIADLLRQMADGDIAAVDVREDVTAAYKERVDDAHSRMIWTHPGMTTYYRNAAGRVVTTSPWRAVDFWRMTRHADLQDYRVTSKVAAAAHTMRDANSPDEGVR